MEMRLVVVICKMWYRPLDYHKVTKIFQGFHSIIVCLCVCGACGNDICIAKAIWTAAFVFFFTLLIYTHQNRCSVWRSFPCEFLTINTFSHFVLLFIFVVFLLVSSHVLYMFAAIAVILNVFRYSFVFDEDEIRCLFISLSSFIWYAYLVFTTIIVLSKINIVSVFIVIAAVAVAVAVDQHFISFVSEFCSSSFSISSWNRIFKSEMKNTVALFPIPTIKEWTWYGTWNLPIL